MAGKQLFITSRLGVTSGSRANLVLVPKKNFIRKRKDAFEIELSIPAICFIRVEVCCNFGRAPILALSNSKFAQVKVTPGLSQSNIMRLSRKSCDQTLRDKKLAPFPKIQWKLSRSESMLAIVLETTSR